MAELKHASEAEIDQALIGTRVPVWGILRSDPGFIYVVQNHGQYKIGKTKKAADRLKAAKTWLPDMELVACKPFWNVSLIERELHAGFAPNWYAGEWFKFDSEEDRDILIDGFIAFSNQDRDTNSVSFIYWMNGDGMAEFAMEKENQGLTLPKFLKQESSAKKT